MRRAKPAKHDHGARHADKIMGWCRPSIMARQPPAKRRARPVRQAASRCNCGGRRARRDRRRDRRFVCNLRSGHDAAGETRRRPAVIRPWRPRSRGSSPRLPRSGPVSNAQPRRRCQFAKVSDRLDKVEKAQAEPRAKLAKLNETVDKLRATPAPRCRCAAPTGCAKEVTGSIAPLRHRAPPPALPQRRQAGNRPPADD